MNIIPAKSLLALLNAETKSNGAPFTIQSNRTGKDYTYKIKTSEFNGNMYIHVYVETGYLSFKHLGHFFNGRIYKHRQVVETPSAVAIEWVLRQVSKGNAELVDANVTLTHTSKCLKCGKELTDIESIELGVGPVCAGLI